MLSRTGCWCHCYSSSLYTLHRTISIKLNVIATLHVFRALQVFAVKCRCCRILRSNGRVKTDQERPRGGKTTSISTSSSAQQCTVIDSSWCMRWRTLRASNDLWWQRGHRACSSQMWHCIYTPIVGLYGDRLPVTGKTFTETCHSLCSSVH